MNSSLSQSKMSSSDNRTSSMYSCLNQARSYIIIIEHDFSSSSNLNSCCNPTWAHVTIERASATHSCNAAILLINFLVLVCIFSFFVFARASHPACTRVSGVCAYVAQTTQVGVKNGKHSVGGAPPPSQQSPVLSLIPSLLRILLGASVPAQ